MKQRIIVIGQVLVIIMLASLASVWAKLALNEVPIFSFVWLVILLGLICLSFYSFVLKKEKFPSHLLLKNWFYLLIIGACYYLIYRLSFVYALDKLAVTTHAYIVNFTGFITMLMSVIWLNEKPNVLQLLGAVIAMLGLWVFFKHIPVGDELNGILILSIGVVALALTNILIRHLVAFSPVKLSSHMIATLTIWLGGTPLIIYGLLTDLPLQFSGHINWGIITFNAVVVLALSMVVWSHALKKLRSYEISILASSSVIFTALFSSPLLGVSFF
ncbi:MAG: DMT family transporter, partial [Candidatus Marinimicrobia bacterium]|nr:DMT family transporter [Candidatus Neomarinimicrobiota bacterium]